MNKILPALLSLVIVLTSFILTASAADDTDNYRIFTEDGQKELFDASRIITGQNFFWRSGNLSEYSPKEYNSPGWDPFYDEVSGHYYDMWELALCDYEKLQEMNKDGKLFEFISYQYYCLFDKVSSWGVTYPDREFDSFMKSLRIALRTGDGSKLETPMIIKLYRGEIDVLHFPEDYPEPHGEDRLEDMFKEGDGAFWWYYAPQTSDEATPYILLAAISVASIALILCKKRKAI